MDRTFRILAGQAGHPVNHGGGRRRVAVLGGGVAGIAAAVRLREMGAEVTLVEARDRLGGRATSFVDSQTGTIYDNCQHVLLRCCTNLIDLYERLDVLDRIQWHPRLFFAQPGRRGQFDVLESSAFPAPAHLAPALWRFKRFSLPEKYAISRGMEAIIAADRDAYADETFAHWLDERGQSEIVIRQFWNVVVVSACNLSVDQVGAAPALQVFQEGFAGHRDAWIMGTQSCPLVQLYETAGRFMDDLRLNQRIASVRIDHQRVRSVTTDDGSMIEADAFVMALPYECLVRLFDSAARRTDARLRQPGGLRSSPILGIHLHYDRPVTNLPHLVSPDGGVQWFFFKDAGRYAHGVISAADQWMATNSETIVRHTDRELQSLIPEARNARLTSSRVIKERRATFACSPGSERCRPSTVGEINNLFLAGDYTQTGWPATMEGAARSGYMAAAAAMGADHPAHAIVPDLGSGWFYSLVREVLRARP